MNSAVYRDVEVRERDGATEVTFTMHDPGGNVSTVVAIDGGATRELHRLLGKVLDGDTGRKVPGLMSRRTEEVG